MTANRDYGDENDACTCRKYASDPECPKHGHPGQLTLDEPVSGHKLPNKPFHDPATAPWPEGF